MELNETPRSSGRQKERKSRDRVFIRAATVEKRENDSQCRSTQSTRCDEFRRGKETESVLRWIQKLKRKVFCLSEKYWGLKICGFIVCVMKIRYRKCKSIYV